MDSHGGDLRPIKCTHLGYVRESNTGTLWKIVRLGRVREYRKVLGLVKLAKPYSLSKIPGVHDIGVDTFCDVLVPCN